MALNPQLASVAANTATDAVTALLNGGTMDLYDGAQPATSDVAVTTQVRLARLAFGNPAFASASGGAALANAISDDLDAAATGTASWFRAVKSDGVTAILDGSIGLAGTDLVLSSVAIDQHKQVSILGFTYTQARG